MAVRTLRRNRWSFAAGTVSALFLIGSTAAYAANVSGATTPEPTGSDTHVSGATTDPEHVSGAATDAPAEVETEGKEADKKDGDKDKDKKKDKKDKKKKERKQKKENRGKHKGHDKHKK